MFYKKFVSGLFAMFIVSSSLFSQSSGRNVELDIFLEDTLSAEIIGFYNFFPRFKNAQWAIFHVTPTDSIDATVCYSKDSEMALENINNFSSVTGLKKHIDNIRTKYFWYSPSDNDSSVLRITIRDGTEIIGNIIDQDEFEVIVVSGAGIEMKIPRNELSNIEPVQGEWNDGEFWQTDPNRTRLLFAPTARALETGKGYISVYEIFFPFLSIGVTDFLTLSGGLSLIPGAKRQILYLAPKVTALNGEDFSLGGGVLYATISEHRMGIAYSVTTYGNSTAAVTAGLGYGFDDNDWADSPMIMIGGEVQVSKSIKLLSENWFFPGGDHLISLGIRFFGSSLAVDFALISSGEAGDGFPFIPWVGFVANF